MITGILFLCVYAYLYVGFILFFNATQPYTRGVSPLLMLSTTRSAHLLLTPLFCSCHSRFAVVFFSKSRMPCGRRNFYSCKNPIRNRRNHFPRLLSDRLSLRFVIVVSHTPRHFIRLHSKLLPRCILRMRSSLNLTLFIVFHRYLLHAR